MRVRKDVSDQLSSGQNSAARNVTHSPFRGGTIQRRDYSAAGLFMLTCISTLPGQDWDSLQPDVFPYEYKHAATSPRNCSLAAQAPDALVSSLTI